MVRAIRLFAPESFMRVLLIDIALIAASFFVAGYPALFLDPSIYFTEEGGAPRLAPIILSMVLAMYFADLYGRKPAASRILLLQQLSFAGGIALLSQALVAYLNPDWILPRMLTFAGVAVSIAAIFVWRLILAVIVSRMTGARAVLILGTGETVRRIARHIERNPELNYRIAGSLTGDSAGAVQPVLGPLADLSRVAVQLKPALIIASFADGRERMPVPDLLDLRFGGATIEEAGSACEIICRRVSARDLRPSRTLFGADFDPREKSLFVLIADRLIAAVLLILGAPFAALCALLEAVNGRSALATEMCAGFRGRPFQSRQLRVAGNGLAAALVNRLHLGDYPQLWNVITGKMSMVGPRPERLGTARELERLLPVYDYRQNTLPGITGWAQLHRPAGGSVIDSLGEVEYDLYYVRNQAPSLYAFILLHDLKRRAA
jgi:lipopolysaccharide/colanic/teichoic acid biosynthesis glycosyltransferase